jgi:hypothetical protein
MGGDDGTGRDGTGRDGRGDATVGSTVERDCDRRTDRRGATRRHTTMTTPPDGDDAATAASAWERAIDDAGRLARERERAGRETLVTVAGHTAVRTGVDAPTFVYTVPGRDAATLAAWVDAPAAWRSLVYGRVVGDRVYRVTELRHPVRESTAFVVGSHSPLEGRRAMRGADPDGPVRSVVRSLDDAARVTFEHDDPSPFLEVTRGRRDEDGRT